MHSPRLPHLMPHARQPIVFLTAVTADRRQLLSNEPAHFILRQCWQRSAVIDGWTVGRYIVMPDHVHLFARASPTAKPLAVWVRTWKSVTSRKLAVALRVASPVWQKDYFDRFLRSVDDYSEKWDYVRRNPERSGLVVDAATWPWQGVLEDLSY